MVIGPNFVASSIQPLHIPDGYLSPVTSGIMFALAIPFWYFATQRLRREPSAKMVPLIALLAAFSFVIMMFNVPIPGGTTAHAPGAALAAIVLGPWAAIIAISIALLIQALFFGDGGILAYWANVFNLAIVAPLAGYSLYHLLYGKGLLGISRPAVAGAIFAEDQARKLGLLQARVWLPTLSFTGPLVSPALFSLVTPGAL